MDSIWNHDGGAEPRHFCIAIYFALAFIATRFLLDALVYQRLAIWFLSNGTVPLKLSEAKHTKIAKCSESMWKLTYYATAELCVLSITYHEPWFSDIKEYFKGWPNQDLKFSLKFFYMCQCGFYIYSIAALLTWETRRKDFSMMMSHHVITVILIGYSYITSYNLLKVVTHSDPYHVLLYYVFNTMLLTLLVFHIYWGILICSMVLRQLKNSGRVGEDIRSDSEDGDLNGRNIFWLVLSGSGDGAFFDYLFIANSPL